MEPKEKISGELSGTGVFHFSEKNKVCSKEKEMKVAEHNELIDKAKTKKDGVYARKPYLYAVKAGKFIAYADYGGNVYAVMGMFHHKIGTVEIYDKRKALLEYIRK